MPTNVLDLAGWRTANEALASAMGSVLDFLATVPPSADPESDFQQARALRNQLTDLSGRLAAQALNLIDEEIASSGLVDDISELSQRAKDEAEALKEAAKTVQGIASVVDKIAGVVTGIAGLPFL